MPDIDLEKPGKLTASGLNAKDYTFFIMKNQAQYTAQALAANPDCVTAADLILKSGVIPDASGKADWDLAPLAKDLKAKMTEPFIDVLVGVVGTAKPTDADPKKRLADVQNYKLMKGTPSLKLDKTKAELEVTTDALVSVDMKYVDSVQLKMDPADVFHMSKTALNKSDTLTLTALKDGKATLTATGIQDGKTLLTEKIDFISHGLSLLLPGIGYKPPA